MYLTFTITCLLTSFLQIRTNLQPHSLLTVLKRVENSTGRVPSVRNGPRAIDLDLVLYGDQIIDSRAPDERNTLENLDGQLVIPHPRMAEREFVLRPLFEYAYRSTCFFFANAGHAV